MLNAYFRVQGYDTETVNWGEDCLRACQTNPPDLILLDINLPDIDGYEICRILRSNTRTSYVPIIFLTQKDERSDKLQGLELGADDYITKPFSPRQLVARAQAVLRRAGKTPAPAIRQVGELRDLAIGDDVLGDDPRPGQAAGPGLPDLPRGGAAGTDGAAQGAGARSLAAQ